METPCAPSSYGPARCGPCRPGHSRRRGPRRGNELYERPAGIRLRALCDNTGCEQGVVLNRVGQGTHQLDAVGRQYFTHLIEPQLYLCARHGLEALAAAIEDDGLRRDGICD